MLDNTKIVTDEVPSYACLDASTHLNGGLWCSMALCRYKRKLLVFTIMCCTTVWIVMFVVGISCCAVIHRTNSESRHVLIVKDWQAPEVHLQQLRSEPENAMSKKLLQDSSSWFKEQEKDVQGSNRRSYKLLEHLTDNVKPWDHQEVGDDDEEIINSELSQNDENHERTSRTKLANSDTVISRNSQDGTRKLPQAIIIGVKKGGTRALLEFLRIHPDVRAPGPETHFFDRYYHKGLDWYRRQMPPTIPGQMTIEKTPSYLITKEVPRRIYSMSKDIKLIVVVRDPVTRAISDYTQAASKRGMKPFEQMAFLNNYTGLVNTSWGAIRIGVYAKYVDRWLKYFPLKQMHFVHGEKLITDPANEMAKVQDFLGLKRVINEKHFYFNETKGFPCLKKKEGSARPHCLGKSKGRPHPSVSSQVLSRLQDFFRPFNAKFYQMVGYDFGWP